MLDPCCRPADVECSVEIGQLQYLCWPMLMMRSMPLMMDSQHYAVHGAAVQVAELSAFARNEVAMYRSRPCRWLLKK